MAAGRYKILEELGVGGAGTVYKAYDTQLDRYVALKRLLTKEEEQTQDTQSSGLRKEAASLATLQHPNIVTIYDLGSDEEGFFIVMELLEGDTLGDWIRSSTLGLADFYELAQQTLEGVLLAHSQSILHRDLKPENIKVQRMPGGRLQVKIVDFGLARLSYGAKKQTEDVKGHVLGSIYYMAPEQFLRRPLDGRTDLYSLGCVFYQALSGRRPFQHESVAGVMDLHLKHEVPLLHDVCPHLPERLCDWVMWLMNREPAERPPNAQTALDALRSLAAEGALSEAPIPAVAPVQSQPLMPARPVTGGVARPGTMSQPLRRTTSSGPVRPTTGMQQPARPTTSMAPHGPGTTGARQVIHTTALIDDDPGGTGARPAAPARKKGKSNAALWVSLVAALAVLGAGGYYVMKKRAAVTKPATGGDAGQPQTAGAVPKQPGDLFLKGAIIHWRAGERIEAWSDPGKPSPPARANDLVLNWHDLAPDAGDAILSSYDRKQENCPRYLVEQPAEFKDKAGYLRFDPGDGMMHKMDKDRNKNEAKSYPFGEAVKDKGLTLFMIVRPKVIEKEVCCVRLRNQDGGASIQITAFPTNEFRVKVTVKQADGKEVMKEGKVGGRSVKMFSLLSLRVDPATKRATLMVRSSSDGGKSRGECELPPNCPLLNEVRLSDVVKDAAHPPPSDTLFTGDVMEIALWNRVMSQEDHAEQAQKLAAFYFKNPGQKW